MTDIEIPIPSRTGRLYYKPHQKHFTRPPSYTEADPYPRPRDVRPHYVRVFTLREQDVQDTREKEPSLRGRRTGKLAANRDSALRFLRSVITPHSSTPKVGVAQDGSQSRRHSDTTAPTVDESLTEMLSADSARSMQQQRINSLPINAHLRRPSLQDDSRQSSSQSNVSIRTQRAGSLTKAEDKPLASANGVSINVNLAEPYLFLQGHDENDRHTRSTAMLRGSLHLKIAKNVKIKAVTLSFKGNAMTKWPEGIPPKKVEFEENNTLMSHTWPFFNAQFPQAEHGSGADQVTLMSSTIKAGSPYLSSSPISSSINVTGRDQKRLSLQVNQARSFEKGESGKGGHTVAQRGYRTFYPGDYVYNFELPLDSRLPESIEADLGSVKYELEATVERAGAFKTNLMGHKEVVLIRAPSEGSLEQVEPIAISRNWEDQLHYDIVISGKSFPLGAKVPIAFKLTPLAKVQLHRIKVFVTENTEYFCSHKRVHRMEPARKVLLFEKRADSPSSSTFPGSNMRITAGGGVPYDQRSAAANGQDVSVQDTGNLLGRLEGESNVGPTEMEFNVQLPGCRQNNEKERACRLHFDTTYQNIQVHHWIKIVMRLSRPDSIDPSKRRHFEISIDSPFHILSCRATQANISLPAYSSPNSAAEEQNLAECGCPGAPRRRISPTHLPTLNGLNEARQNPGNANGADAVSEVSTSTSATESSAPVPMHLSLPRPRQAHIENHHAVQRPMHMLRAPSFNPPAFEEEEPPPPLVTPPPNYADIASPSHGLEDYFTRFHTAYDDESDEDPTDDGVSRSSTRGRVNIPLTPGRRAARSVDSPRSPGLV